MGWAGIHLVVRGAEQVITRGVEAEPGHGALVGTDHLDAGGVGNGPDPDRGVGRSREHQVLQQDNTGRFMRGEFGSPRAPNGRFHQRMVPISKFEAPWKRGKSRAHLGWVEHDAGDLLGMALERGQDLLRALVEHDDIFVGPTWKSEWEALGWECGANPQIPFKFLVTQGKRPAPRWKIPKKAPLPVRILLVSEGHRSKARIPGMLALCSPCVREEHTTLTPQAGKHSQRELRRDSQLHGGVFQSFPIQALTTCEATCRYLLSSSGFTSSSGTVLPLWKKQG